VETQQHQDQEDGELEPGSLYQYAIKSPVTRDKSSEKFFLDSLDKLIELTDFVSCVSRMQELLCRKLCKTIAKDAVKEYRHGALN
jgi:hypothetical protein